MAMVSVIRNSLLSLCLIATCTAASDDLQTELQSLIDQLGADSGYSTLRTFQKYFQMEMDEYGNKAFKCLFVGVR